MTREVDSPRYNLKRLEYTFEATVLTLLHLLNMFLQRVI